MKEFLNEIARLWWIEVGTELKDPMSEISINGLRKILKEEFNFDSDVVEYIVESVPTNFAIGETLEEEENDEEENTETEDGALMPT